MNKSFAVISKDFLNNLDVDIYELKSVLRIIAKKEKGYFDPSLNDDVNNIGCVLFGQPNAWEGLISVKQDGKKVHIYVKDHGNEYDVEKAKELLRKTIKTFAYLSLGK